MRREQTDRHLGRVGYTLLGRGWHRGGWDYRLHRIGRPPSGFELLRRDPTRCFSVELDRVTTPTGFSCHPRGWHPYRAALTERLAQPDLPYHRSILSAFYRRFQPTTVQEAILEDVTEPLPPLSTMPPIRALFMHVWALTPRRIRAIDSQRGPATAPPQQFGPQSEEGGREHLRRLVRTHESLQQRGYRPDEFRDGALTGYFLVRDGDYRFVILHGNHRLAPLLELGIAEVDARFHPAHPPIVHADELHRWVSTRPGGFSSGVAHQLFEKLFTERGDVKAMNLGLLPAR